MRKTALLTAVLATVMVVPIAAYAIHSFTDVPDGAFYHNSVAWMKTNGITAGCNPPANTEYCPNDSVSRGEMAVFLKRLAEKKVVDAATAVDADKLDGLDSGYFLPAEIPLGATVLGTIGAQVYTPTTSDEIGANAQLPIPAPVGLTDAFVTVAGGVDDTDGACTGTASAPTADPGYVCIYPYSTSNTTSHRGFIWGGGDGTKWGFQVSWFAPSSGQTFFFANWAYTAPTSLASVSGASPSGDPSDAGGN